MNKKNRVRVLLLCSIALLFIMSATVLLMPYAVSISESNQALLIIVGVLFWFSLVAGYTTLIVSCRLYKSMSGADTQKRMPGVLLFFTNTHGVIVDILLIISVILIAAFSFTPLIRSYVMYVLISILTFSFNLHCIVNGRIYNAIKK